MRHYIITGASRGLGEAMVRELLSRGNSLFCISRSLNEELIARSTELGVELHWVQTDLAATTGGAEILQPVFDQIDAVGAEAVCLINNAATLEPLGLTGTGNAAEIARAIQINLIAPMVLTNAFVAHFTDRRYQRTVISISSGAGSRAMPGLSTYSTTKAGLNMFTTAAAADHDGADGSGIRFFAVSPGTVDTAMQETLRAAGPSVLPSHATYVRWKEENALVEPANAARTVLSLESRNDIENGAYVHIRDL